MRPIADPKLIRNIDPGRIQLLDFLEQRQRIDHQAIPNYSCLSRAQNPARYQTQHELAVPNQNRVARVMPALVTHNVVEAVGQQIDQLALAFVAPLRAEDDDIAHVYRCWRSIFAKRAIVTHCVTLASDATFRRVSATRRRAPAATLTWDLDRKTEDLPDV